MHTTTTTPNTPNPRAESDAPVVAAGLGFGRLEQAWNQADGDAFGRAFTDDADFVDIRGDHHQGRTAIALGHQGIFDTIYAGSSVRFDVEAARAIAPGVVVAVAGSTMTAPTGPLQGTNHARMTAVLTLGFDGWAVAAFHNTLRATRG
jgi:uncharacterized protein (TIGR02246 family)